MHAGLSVAVVVPAFNEGDLILRTLAGIPDWVSAIYVVDDASRDDTQRRVRAFKDPRVRLVVHTRNLGVGAAITTGYRHAAREGMKVAVVMAGDDQMDPRDLELVVSPLLEGKADYVKGNRFLHPEARKMPWPRRVGGRYLSLLTRLMSGLRIDDAQCGYTGITLGAIEQLPLDEVWPRFGYPNDLLLLLASRGLRVVEVPVRPVYGGQQSGIRPWHVLTITYRMWQRWVSLGDTRSLHRHVDVAAFVVNPVEAGQDCQPRQAR